ncbi:hypothetical protein DYB31_003525 [Aphanomyces astaci]|uniref:Uncharacterized protein n=2 Tax=Aphanomyces astaci TaxID=112090 RepID=A0A397ER65_APHAT|nr:hypothetical protein DYB31_003525 [Aphanomyces astaci]
MAASPPDNNDVNGITLDQTYVNGSGGGKGGAEATAAAPATRSLSLKVNVLTGLVVLVFLQLIALWILVFMYHVPIDSLKLSNDIFKTSDALKDKPLSFGPDGMLRAGAGTTAYLDAGVLPSDAIQYVQLARLPSATTSSSVLFSYYLPTKSQTVVTTATAAADKSLVVADVKTANIVTNQIRGTAILSGTAAVLLEQTSSGAVFVTPAVLSPSSVDVVPANRVAVTTGSVSNAIGAISPTQFAVSYFDAYNATGLWYQNVVGGTLHADGTVALSSPPLRFGDANFDDATTQTSQSVTFAKPVGISSTPGTFLQPWWTPTAAGSNKGLCLLLGQTNATATVKVSEVCNDQFTPSSFVDISVVAPATAVIALYNSKANAALTLLLVEVFGSNVFFRSSFVLEESAGEFDFGSFYSWYPAPSLALVGPGRIAVAFLNANRRGQPHTQLFSIRDGRIDPVTPLIRVSKDDFSLAGHGVNQTSGAVTIAAAAVSPEAYVVAFGGQLDALSPKRLTLVESFGPLVGIGAKGVVVQGVVKVGTGLTVGSVYYTTTRGDIVEGPPGGSVVYFSNNATAVADSRLGVAVDSKAIYIAPSPTK